MPDFSEADFAGPATFTEEDFAPPRVKRTRAEVEASIPPSDLPSPLVQRLWNTLAWAAPLTETATAPGMLNMLTLPQPKQPRPFVIDTVNNTIQQQPGMVRQPAFEAGKPIVTSPLKDRDINPLADLASGVVESATTPETLVTAPAMAGSGLLANLVKAYYAISSGKQASEAGQQALDPTLTPHERIVGGGNFLANLGIGVASGRGMMTPELPKTGIKPEVDPYANVSPWEKSLEQGKREAQAAPVILGDNLQPIIKSINVEPGAEIVPATQGTRAPVEPSGGEVSFRAPAAAEAIPNAQQSILAANLEGAKNASKIRSNQGQPVEVGSEQTGRGDTSSENLQQPTQEGQSPSGQQGVQEVRPLEKPIEQRGPLGGNVSTFGLFDPAEWKRMGSDVKSATAGVGKAFDKLYNDRTGLVEQWKRGQDRGNVVMTFQSIENGALDTARKATSTLTVDANQKFGQQTSKRAREALPVFAEAQLKGGKDALNKFEAQATKAGYKKAVELVKFARANWGRLQDLAKTADVLDKQNLGVAKASGVKITERDSYFKRMYEDPNEGFIFNRAGGGTGTGKSSMMARQFDTVFDAIEAGKKVKVWDAAELIGKRTEEIQREANFKTWTKNFESVPDSVTKLPLAAKLVDRGNGVMGAPDGYVEITLGRGQRLAVMKGYEGLFDALTGTSRISGSIPGRFALETVGAVKHGTLAVDAFHAFRVYQFLKSLDATGSYKHGLSLLEYNRADLAKAVEQKLVPKDVLKYADEKFTTPQGKFDSYDIMETGKQNGLMIGRHSEALYTSFIRNTPGFKQTVGAAHKFIFDELTRGAIATAYRTEFVKQGNAHPEWTTQQLAQNVARDINFRMGAIGKQGIFKSRSMQDIMQLAFNAPRWVESMAQSEVRSAGQLAKSVIPGSGSFGNRGTLGRSTSNLVGIYLVATQVANYLSTGHSTLENPEGHKLDAWVPPLTKEGKGYWVNPLSVAAELTHDVLRYNAKGEDTTVGKILLNKASPHARAIAAGLFGKTWHGDVEGAWNRTKEAFAQYDPTPFPGQAVKQAVQKEELAPVVRQGFANVGIKAEPESNREVQQRNAQGKTFNQRTDQAITRKMEREPRSRQETFQATEYATKQQMKRAQAIESALPSDMQSWLQQQKLQIPLHEESIRLLPHQGTLSERSRNALQIPLKQDEINRYESLLQSEYNTQIRLMMKDPQFSNLDYPTKKMHFEAVMSTARRIAEGNLMRTVK